MTVRKRRILIRFDWADEQVTRLWLGAGPYADADGALWKGAGLVNDEGLDEIEQAVNGNAAGLDVGLSGVSPETAGVVWTYYQAGNLIESEMRILIQPCNDRHRPVGSARTVFTGTIRNVVFQHVSSAAGTTATVTGQVSNKFTLRRLQNGGVLSDADQRARSAILNPLANPDLFCERVLLMQNKTRVWPRFS